MKLFHNIFILAISLSMIITSCTKNEIDITNQQDVEHAALVNMINNYQPSNIDVGGVYQDISNRFSYSLKQSLPDVSADTAFWYVETHLNTKLGFYIDTVSYKYEIVFDTVEFTINGYNNNIPLIDGDELDTFLTNKEVKFLDENTDADDVFFWCNIF